MTRSTLRVAITATLLAGLASATVSADDVADRPSAPAATEGLLSMSNVTIVTAAVPQPQQAAAQSIASAGMRAFKDKDTGRLRNPTVNEMSELDTSQATPARAGREVVTRALPSGMHVAEIDASFDAYSVVRKSPDGHLHADCADGEHAAIQLISSERREELANDR